jgi:hypothetical protein
MLVHSNAKIKPGCGTKALETAPGNFSGKNVPPQSAKSSPSILFENTIVEKGNEAIPAVTMARSPSSSTFQSRKWYRSTTMDLQQTSVSLWLQKKIENAEILFQKRS